MDVDLIILIAFGILFLIGIIRTYLDPERKEIRERQRARKAERKIESKVTQELLQDFNPELEKQDIINTLKYSLPIGYRCKRMGCSGVLLKGGSKYGQRYFPYYACSDCGSIRQLVKLGG